MNYNKLAISGMVSFMLGVAYLVPVTPGENCSNSTVYNKEIVKSILCSPSDGVRLVPKHKSGDQVQNQTRMSRLTW